MITANFFKFEKGRLAITNDTAIALVPEFKTILNHKKAVEMFSYLFIKHSPTGHPYAAYDEDARNKIALDISKLTDKDLKEDVFISAERAFIEIENSDPKRRTLRATKDLVDRLIKQVDDMDLSKLDKTEKPIYRPKDVIAIVEDMVRVHKTLDELESALKETNNTSVAVRGGHQRKRFD